MSTRTWLSSTVYSLVLMKYQDRKILTSDMNFLLFPDQFLEFLQFIIG